MDFGFMRASADNYKHPNKAMDKVVLSYNDNTAYLLVVDGASRHPWCFLTMS
jgi:hypothetical protein